MPKGLVESDDWLEVCEREANRLISAHMEKVTRILEQGPPVVAQRSQFDHREDPTDHEV